MKKLDVDKVIEAGEIGLDAYQQDGLTFGGEDETNQRIIRRGTG